VQGKVGSKKAEEKKAREKHRENQKLHQPYFSEFMKSNK
jgi:hypothetical protein